MTPDALSALVQPEPWMADAECQYVDPELHYPDKGESTGPAKRVCSGCEVITECLAYALDHSERYGVWGGLSERERRRLKGDRGNHACFVCHRRFANRHGLNIHLSTHGELHHCPQFACGRSFSTPQNLRRHAQRVHGEPADAAVMPRTGRPRTRPVRAFEADTVHEEAS
jgi:WhiB family redox-sensing transcriptional regulator